MGRLSCMVFGGLAGRVHHSRGSYVFCLEVGLQPAHRVHHFLALLLQELGVQRRALSRYRFCALPQLRQGLLEVPDLLVVLQNEDLVLLGDGLYCSFGLVGLLVVGVDGL